MHNLRSDIHIVEYLILGVVLYLFEKAMNWPTWLILIIGIDIGACDKVLKIFLPTREFDWVDLSKDAIGVFCSVIICQIIVKAKRLLKR